MNVPVQVTFRNMTPSDAIIDYANTRAKTLFRVCDRITHCRVTIEMDSRRGSPVFHVRIELAIPGEDVVVHRDATDHSAEEDVVLAVKGAFNLAKKQLQEHMRRVREMPKFMGAYRGATAVTKVSS